MGVFNYLKVSNEEKMGLKVQNEVILRARSIVFSEALCFNCG